MRNQDVAALERELAAEFEQHRQEYEEKLKAIKIVQGMLAKSGLAHDDTRSDLGNVTRSPSGNGRSLIAEVKSILGTADKEWSSPTMLAELQSRDFNVPGKAQVSIVGNAMKRLAEKGQAVRVRKGKPNWYKGVSAEVQHQTMPSGGRKRLDVPLEKGDSPY